MNIVYCTDNNYKGLTEISIRTVRKYNPDANIVIVSDFDNPVENVEGANGYFHWHIGEHRRKGETDRISNAAYLKCVLPLALPCEKVIYIDPDVECKGSLNELYDMPCKYINLCESHAYGKQQAEALGIEKYGLTGMMVMNLKNLLKIDFTCKCFDIEKMAIEQKYWQHDETCINLAMRDKLTFIDKKWNYCFNRTYDDPVKPSDVRLLHYVGAKNKLEFIELPFYRELDKVKQAIKGKDVAIVGNAESIFDTVYGDLIDKHDFVIRFNKGFITKPESQGSKTDLLMLACCLSKTDALSYGAKYIVNRSKSYPNAFADFTISNDDRKHLCDFIGAQPSTGFMAIDLCLEAGANSITLFGFDFGQTQTFYNEPDYITQHSYSTEEKLVLDYVKNSLVKVEW